MVPPTFRADGWLLYDMDSPNAYGARGLARGFLFTRDGTLVVSMVQEGLMRLVKSPVREAERTVHRDVIAGSSGPM